LYTQWSNCSSFNGSTSATGKWAFVANLTNWVNTGPATQTYGTMPAAYNYSVSMSNANSWYTDYVN